MQRSQLFNIFLVVFIVMLGFGLIMPLMPFFAAKYGASSSVVGLLVAAYAAAQFVGAPILGRMSDRMGRRPLLVVSMAGTAFGFALLGLAEPLGKALASLFAADPTPALQNGVILGMMFLSRIICGLFGGMITVAQAYIADVTDARTRTQGMGMIGAAFGLGFVVGPVLGGVLSQWGFAVPSFAAAGMALLNLGTILFMLPESLTEARKAELARQKGPGKQPLIDLPAMMGKLGKPRLGPLLTVRLFVSLAMSLFMALFTLWAKDRLGLSAQVTSYVMAYNGLLSIVAQMGLIGPLTKRFPNAQLIFWGVVILSAAMLGWAFTASTPVLLVVMVPMAFATGVLNTVIGAATSWSVRPEEMGDALGTSSAFESLSRVIAPSVGGWLLGAAGTWAPGALGGVLLAGLAVFAYRRLIVNPDPPLPAPALLGQAALKPASAAPLTVEAA